MRRVFSRLRYLLSRRSMATLVLAVGSTAYLCTAEKQDWFPRRAAIRCWGNNQTPEAKIQQLLAQSIMIKQNGDSVGVAYCLAPDIFVTSSPEVFSSETANFNQSFQCFKEKFRFSHPEVIGRYDNLTFLRIKDTGIAPIGDAQAGLFTQTILLNRRQYPQMKLGFLVDKESGYGIVNQSADPGSAVLAKGELVGLVTKVGATNLQDYCMFTYWKDIKNLQKRIQNGTVSPFLGISVKGQQNYQGAFVMRIASDSPFARHLHLGDVITKVNGEQVGSATDLQRLIAFSDKQVSVTASYQGKQRTFTLEI